MDIAEVTGNLCLREDIAVILLMNKHRAALRIDLVRKVQGRECVLLLGRQTDSKRE